MFGSVRDYNSQGCLLSTGVRVSVVKPVAVLSAEVTKLLSMTGNYVTILGYSAV
jgi:hypothetical protein